jgi:hypothetical protein
MLTYLCLCWLVVLTSSGSHNHFKGHRLLVSDLVLKPGNYLTLLPSTLTLFLGRFTPWHKKKKTIVQQKLQVLNLQLQRETRNNKSRACFNGAPAKCTHHSGKALSFWWKIVPTPHKLVAIFYIVNSSKTNVEN